MRGEPVPRNGQKDKKSERALRKCRVFFPFSRVKSECRQLVTLTPPPFCLLRHSCTGAEDAAGRKTERFWERSPRLRK